MIPEELYFQARAIEREGFGSKTEGLQQTFGCVLFVLVDSVSVEYPCSREGSCFIHGTVLTKAERASESMVRKARAVRMQSLDNGFECPCV